LRALTFVDEYDPPLTLEECIHWQFRGVIRLVFRTLVESALYFWSRILITPTIVLLELGHLRKICEYHFIREVWAQAECLNRQ
jgi:hypothetical protein